MIGFEHSEMRSRYDALVELVAHKSPTLAPDIFQVPVSEYTDRERWEREVELLRSTPMVLALSSELTEPGSYWALTRLGVPMILVRQKSGEVRLFINACRHRGAKILEDGHGRKPRFTCIYHAWTYGLDGRLVGLPSENIFGDVDKADFGLTELAVEERFGLIWAILTPDMPLDLDAFLGPDLLSLLPKFGLERFKVVNLKEVPAANWKLAYEGYVETYHFPSLHAQSFGSFVIPGVIKVDSRGIHGEIVSPVLGIQEKCDPSSLDDLKRYVQSGFTIFPSTFYTCASTNAFAGEEERDGPPLERMFMNQILPGNSPGESVTISRTVVSGEFEGTPMEQEVREWADLTHKVVITEDCPVVNSIQETVYSGAQKYFTFGRNESAIHHFHRELHKALGDEPLDRPRKDK
ncbi:aromatic ring-hydroxylating dioxygenase subunit alpha [Sphingobium sp. AN641]|uniref:aromatic ring-hydroxylating oxygenase subunit alpha n=1 Tax=Sphingobium sp. AN641 TaxID=3133443 RepID=UPI0030BD7504